MCFLRLYHRGADSSMGGVGLGDDQKMGHFFNVLGFFDRTAY